MVQLEFDLNPANRVKYFRITKGISISELAKRANLSRNIIYKMEREPPESTRAISKSRVANALKEKPLSVFPRDAQLVLDIGNEDESA